jgi:hypothetical protein
MCLYGDHRRERGGDAKGTNAPPMIFFSLTQLLRKLKKPNAYGRNVLPPSQCLSQVMLMAVTTGATIPFGVPQLLRGEQTAHKLRVHTHTHTHTHASHTHTHTHSRLSHTQTHTLTPLTHTNTLTRTHAYTLTTHAYTYTITPLSHTHSHAHTHSH